VVDLFDTWGSILVVIFFFQLCQENYWLFLKGTGNREQENNYYVKINSLYIKLTFLPPASCLLPPKIIVANLPIIDTLVYLAQSTVN
jgi:hypothetical protein